MNEYQVWRRLQRRAVALVSGEVRNGRLPRLYTTPTPCVDCGRRALVYEHRDYARPLDVDPVCDPCNRRRGPACGSPFGPEPRLTLDQLLEQLRVLYLPPPA